MLQVICERMKDATKSIREEIEQLLRDAYFVPVLRSVDAVLQPSVGETFSTKMPLVKSSVKSILCAFLCFVAFPGD
jgi:hypothetical protein